MTARQGPPRSPRATRGSRATTGRRDPCRVRSRGWRDANDLGRARLRQCVHEDDPSGLNALPSSSLTAADTETASSADGSLPGSRQQKIHAVSPFTSWGTPIAAASRTAGTADRGGLELGGADPLACDVQRVVGAPVQVPEAVCVDGGPVAVHPDAGDARPVRLDELLGVAPEAARHARERPADNELTDLAGADERLAGVVDYVHRHAERRPADQYALIGPIGVGERKQAPDSVPPVQLITGTREPPTFSNSHRYGSGFHGPPVVTNVRKDEKVGDGVAVRQERPCECRRETERGDALLLDRAPQAVGRRPVGRALREHDRAAERSDADERPRADDQLDVGREVHHVARVHVGLVTGLARRRRGSPPHVDDALWRSVGAGGVRGDGVSEGTSSAGRTPGWSSSSNGARTTCSTDGDSSSACSRMASIGIVLPRREDSCCVITTFASLACRRWATAGAAKPEKTGTWIAPMCATACEAIATSGDIGRKIATRSPGSTPRSTSSSARRVTSRDSSAKLSSRRAPSSARPTAAIASAAARPPVDAVVRDRDGAAVEPRRPLGAARVVEHRLPGTGELRPRRRSRAARTSRAPRTSGAGARPSCYPGPAHEPGCIGVLEGGLVGPPDDVGHGRHPTGAPPS